MNNRSRAMACISLRVFRDLLYAEYQSVRLHVFVGENTSVAMEHDRSATQLEGHCGRDAGEVITAMMRAIRQHEAKIPSYHIISFVSHGSSLIGDRTR